ncbi:MAG: hypothetical protein JSS81_13660 [Acidobacteria bacterium]|nr:hypothetical protein [Acidobacteriota bacterium]
MLNKSKMTRFLSLSLVVAGFLLTGGHFAQIHAQRDPFATPDWKKPKKTVTTTPTGTTTGTTPKPEKKLPPVPMPVPAPAIEARINYYKDLRNRCVESNCPNMPKVTSVLTLDEMAVTGIFKTPRGYAAMVEATPIKLSYTIYPGEKFFDGQLVAIEENRLVFRRVVKMSDGKSSRFISSVENKTLRQYTVRQEIEGTAPVESNSGNKTEVVASNNTAPQTTAPVDDKTKTAAPTVIISPVDEMNKQPASKPEDADKDKNKKNKKPVKVAKKS